MNLPNFWYGSCSNGLLWENHTLCAGKILIWRKFGHSRPKFPVFLAKIDTFESFWPITSKRRYECSYFLYWKLFLWSSSFLIFYFNFSVFYVFALFRGTNHTSSCCYVHGSYSLVAMNADVIPLLLWNMDFISLLLPYIMT